MELIERTFEYRKYNEEFTIGCIADMHLGAKGCDKERLKRDVSRHVDNPNFYWFGGGDYIDAIVPSDARRFDPKTIDPSFTVEDLSDLPKAQMAEVASILSPIKSRCLGFLRGNHEESIRKKHFHDVLEWLCAEWGVPSLNDTCMMRLKFRRLTNGDKPPVHIVKIFASHTRIAGKKKGSKINRLRELFGQFDADVYFAGHGHDRVKDDSFVHLTVPNKGTLRLLPKRKIGIMTGSYLRTYQEGSSGYGETALYQPCDMGFLGVTIQPDKLKFKIYDPNEV